MQCGKINCSDSEWTHATLEPDPDISGLGVLAGFLGTAWMTLMALAVHYVAIPIEQPSNPLDQSLQRHIRRVVRWNSHKDWSRPLRTFILAASDQQLVTGLAMLVGAYSQLSCGISIYHWQIVTTLAWFSSVTHLATIPFLQAFLESHKYLLYLRVVLMSGLAIMLSIVLLRGGDLDTPAICGAWANGPETAKDWFYYDGGVYTVVSEVILLGTLITRLLRMFSQSNNYAIRCLRYARATWKASIIWFCAKLQGRNQWITKTSLLAPVLSLSVLIAIQALLDFMRSRTWEVLWLMLSLIWGTIRLFDVRSRGVLIASDILEENYWDFGQIIPALLLLVPVLMVVESWSEADVSHKEDRNIPELHEELQHPVSGNGQQIQPKIGLEYHVQMTLSMVSSVRPHLSMVDSACTRIISLCTYDLRLEPWYLDNLYFIISFTVGAAPFYLAFAGDRGGLNPELFISLAGFAFFLWWCCLLIIPLCGVVNSLGSRGSRTHAFSIMRIVIDPQMAYQTSRRIFYCSCPVLVALGTGLGLTTGVRSSRGIYAGFFSFVGLYMIPFLWAFFGAIYSLYTQSYTSELE